MIPPIYVRAIVETGIVMRMKSIRVNMSFGLKAILMTKNMTPIIRPTKMVLNSAKSPEKYPVIRPANISRIA
jgi:hypothetical protein